MWLQDDLEFLCKKYYLIDECEIHKDLMVDGCEHHQEVIDTSKYPEDKQELYAKTAREFYFKVFEPKETEDDEDTEIISSDSDLYDDDFDIDSTHWTCSGHVGHDDIPHKGSAPCCGEG